MDKLRTALDRFALAEKAYREKYGEESLDRVIYCDPLNISVAKNKPLEQIPVEFWERLIF